ncbi:MAG TPA: YhjD/YihY/BrkB family envelope integrity protein [Amnibacterium sp.]
MSNGAADQGVRDADVPVQASGARPDPATHATGFPGLVERILALRPVRVWFHYLSDNGPLIAAGMTYQAIFAVFAALWLTFSIAGFVVKGNPFLQTSLFGALDGFIPHLISYTDTVGIRHAGAIKATTLLDAAGLSWSSLISLVGLLLTAVGFVGTLRTAIRIMFDLPGLTTNPVVLILKNAGYTVAFGAVVLVTAIISLVSNTALGLVAALLGLGKASWLEQVATTAVSAVLLLVIDTALLAAAYRLLSGIPIPRKRLLAGALLGGVGLAFLQTLGTSLLGGASANPLIGAFATLIGVLLYFNFVCQVILVAASWIAVGMQDAGIDPRRLTADQRGLDEARELEHARRVVADANRQELEERIRTARGLTRHRLQRQLETEERAEDRRRAAVPTEREFSEAQERSGDTTPDTEEAEAPAPR